MPFNPAAQHHSALFLLGTDKNCFSGHVFELFLQSDMKQYLTNGIRTQLLLLVAIILNDLSSCFIYLASVSTVCERT